MTGSDTFTPNALRPLRHYADFRGRSTRTELVAFYILVMFAAGFGEMVFGALIFASDLPGWLNLTDLILAATLCPWLALAVRRFHDQGRSGWWLLLALPTAAVNAFEYYRETQGRFVEAPGLIEIPAGVCLLALVTLLLWKDQEGTNAYGPNPRFDDPLRADWPERAR